MRGDERVERVRGSVPNRLANVNDAVVSGVVNSAKAKSLSKSTEVSVAFNMAHDRSQPAMLSLVR